MMLAGAKRDMAEAPRGGKAAKAARAGAPGAASAKAAQHDKPVASSAEDKNTRETVYRMFGDALSVGSSGGIHLVVASELEQSVFAVHKGVSKDYRQKAKALKFNLTHNTHLRDRVRSGAILPLDLAAMSSAQMANEDLKKKRHAANKLALFDAVQTEEFLEMRKNAEGAQLLKAQGLVDPKKEDDEAERCEKEERDQEEERLGAEREAVAAAHSKTIVPVAEEDMESYVGRHLTANAGADRTDRNQHLVSLPTLDLHIGTGSSAKPGDLIWTGKIFSQDSTEKSAIPHDPFDMQKSMSDCRMRATLVSGDNVLDQVPKELVAKGPAELNEVIEYLLTEKITVVELEPEGGDDEEVYLQICEKMLREKRARVILDTHAMLMYLIPPHDEAGKLLNPPSDTCANMLGVLIVSSKPPAAGSTQAA
ncbi:transcription factor S-II, central domain-containing protein [Baffinella frigidus]|nr:transcription factor S-II, central domain-containing protein [Cryptophyta sp. CCMP2293]